MSLLQTAWAGFDSSEDILDHDKSQFAAFYWQGSMPGMAGMGILLICTTIPRRFLTGWTGQGHRLSWPPPETFDPPLDIRLAFCYNKASNGRSGQNKTDRRGP